MNQYQRQELFKSFEQNYLKYGKQSINLKQFKQSLSQHESSFLLMKILQADAEFQASNQEHQRETDQVSVQQLSDLISHYFQTSLANNSVLKNHLFQLIDQDKDNQLNVDDLYQFFKSLQFTLTQNKGQVGKQNVEEKNQKKQIENVIKQFSGKENSSALDMQEFTKIYKYI